MPPCTAVWDGTDFQVAPPSMVRSRVAEARTDWFQRITQTHACDASRKNGSAIWLSPPTPGGVTTLNVLAPSEVRATRWLLYVQPSRGLSIWSEPPADSVEKLLVPAPGTGPQAARTRAAASPIRDARRLTTDRS